MPEITLDTVINAQQTLATVKAKHDQYAKELVAAQKRLERKTAELAAAEQTFAQVKSTFEAAAGKPKK